jgi:pimeloyl-ACP methyl ester carboxylesterase
MPEVSNGVKISYDVAGEGRPLLMLHGWTCDRSWWTEPGYTDDLRRDHRVINIDLRGHGDSDKPHDPSAYRIELVTSDVLAVADAEEIDRFAIWGQSYGGLIAWMTAYSVPDRLAAIISGGRGIRGRRRQRSGSSSTRRGSKGSDAGACRACST